MPAADRPVPLVHHGIGRKHRGDFDRILAEIRAVTDDTPETLDPEASEDDN